MFQTDKSLKHSACHEITEEITSVKNFSFYISELLGVPLCTFKNA